jgi:hypothetical protein
MTVKKYIPTEEDKEGRFKTVLGEIEKLKEIYNKQQA